MAPQKFAILKGKVNGSGFSNTWFNRCVEMEVPFITVATQTNYAKVSYDYVTLSIASNEILIENAEAIQSGLIEIFKKYANDKSGYRVTEFVADFLEIEIEKAPLLAEAVFDYFQHFLHCMTNTERSTDVSNWPFCPACGSRLWHNLEIKNKQFAIS